MAKYSRSAPLTSIEIDAVKRYVVEASFLHAIAQGWDETLLAGTRYASLFPELLPLIQGIDSSIQKFTLDEDLTLYAGHGDGVGVRGALDGSASDFVGLTYKYRGFISTSETASVARAFLSKRLTQTSLPTFLEFRLPAGFHALPVNEALPSHEFEYLLPRESAFNVTDARKRGEVLLLSLAPSAPQLPKSPKT